jgi:hypothetical protein
MMEKPFFIVGAQRSGTTLVRLLLNAHSKIAIPEEGTFWMPLLRRSKNNVQREIKGNELENCLKYIQKNPQFQSWGLDPLNTIEKIRAQGGCTLDKIVSEFYVAYAKSFNKDTWGDKTPSFFRMVPVLDALFPHARFIHIVRDGRDIYLSWRKLNIQNRNISVSAFEWIYKVNKARRELESLIPERYLEIRYEDMIAEPSKTLQRICDFLGLHYESRMLEFWKTSNQFIGSHHSKLIFQPISSESVTKWRRELPKKEIRKFESIAGRLLTNLSYELLHINYEKNKKLPVGVIFELAYGIPIRACKVGFTCLILDIASRLGWKTNASRKIAFQGKEIK